MANEPIDVTGAAAELAVWADAVIERAMEVVRGPITDRGERFRLELIEDEEKGRVRYVIETLARILEDARVDAAGDSRALARAEKDYLVEEAHLRDGLAARVTLTARYGIAIVESPVQVAHWISNGEHVYRYRLSVWSPSEIALVAGVLDRLPDAIAASAGRRVKLVVRQAGAGEGMTFSFDRAMDWQDATGRLRIFDAAFARPQDVRRYLVHEIGHATYVARAAPGGFTMLPPADWMAHSDWRCSTEDSLPADLGVSRLEAITLREGLEADRALPFHQRPLREAGGRVVVCDPAEPIGQVASRFFHYPERWDDLFVSDYSRTSPAEDYAESFASYFVDPAGADERVLKRRGPTGASKWDYLAGRYPERGGL